MVEEHGEDAKESLLPCGALRQCENRERVSQ